MLFLLLLLVHRSAFRALPPTLLAEREQPFPVGRIDAAISGTPVRIDCRKKAKNSLHNHPVQANVD
jgi:hypothetical protein